MFEFEVFFGIFSKIIFEELDGATLVVASLALCVLSSTKWFA